MYNLPVSVEPPPSLMFLRSDFSGVHLYGRLGWAACHRTVQQQQGGKNVNYLCLSQCPLAPVHMWTRSMGAVGLPLCLEQRAGSPTQNSGRWKLSCKKSKCSFQQIPLEGQLAAHLHVQKIASSVEFS